MPDTHCNLDMLGVEVPVTVTWCVGRCKREYVLEVEQVTSDVLGDITEKVLNDLCGDGFWATWRQGDKEWHDPVRAALFGTLTVYQHGDKRIRPTAVSYRMAAQDHPAQREQATMVFSSYGTMEHKLSDQIMYTDQWWEAVSDYEAWLSEVD